MRKVLLSAAAILSFGIVSAQQTVSFAVGIPNTTTGFTGVDVTGNWVAAAGLGADWSDALTLADGDGDGVWTGTATLADGSYEAKFRIQGPGASTNWEGVPSGCATNGNRGFTVAGSGVAVGPFCFGTCDVACPSYVPVTVNFHVDFTSAPTVPAGTTTSGGATVNSIFNMTGSLGGDAGFPDWSPGTIAMTQVSGMTYEKTLSLLSKEYQYKFLVADQWNAPDPNDPTTQLEFAEQGPDFDAFDCLNNPVPDNFTNRVLDLSSAAANSTVDIFTSWQSCVLNVGTTPKFELAYFYAVPNPMTDATTIFFSNDNAAEMMVRIADVNGKVLRQFNNVTNNQVAVSRDGMASGMYFVSVINAAGQVNTYKINVQ